MSYNQLTNTYIYGNFAVVNYVYTTSLSGSLSGLIYGTISSPIYQSISSNIYNTISSAIYTSISSTFINTISSTIYNTDGSGNLYPIVTYTNYTGSRISYIISGYKWNTYLSNSLKSKIIIGYTYQNYLLNNVSPAKFINTGNTKLMGNLQLLGMVQTPLNASYALSVSGNIIIHQNYNLKTDKINSNTGTLDIILIQVEQQQILMVLHQIL